MSSLHSFILKLLITLFPDEGQQQVPIFDSVKEVRKNYEGRNYVSVTVDICVVVCRLVLGREGVITTSRKGRESMTEERRLNDAIKKQLAAMA